MSFLSEIKTMLADNPMFAIGVLLIVGYGLGKLARRCHLPEISGYVVAGLLVGHATTGIFPEGMHESFRIVTEIALGLVALTIGVEFSLPKLRRIGRGVIVITVVQVLVVFILVAGLLRGAGMALPFALLLGAIATATEPAAVVAEVHALRARGRFVDHLFSVVALDDAACVIIFSLIFAYAARLLHGEAMATSGAWVQVLWASKEIILSLVLGVMAGLIMHRLTAHRQGTKEILIVSLGIIFIATALAVIFRLSPLLTNLAAGSALINVSPHNQRILRAIEPLTPPVYALFFVIAGTELDYRILMQPGILLFGLIYALARGVGKYGGTWLGCRLGGVGPPLRANMGWCMLPQGGVALGLILLAQASPAIIHMNSPTVEAMLVNLLNIILMCVFISELVGPPLSKMGIMRGCEIVEGRR